MSQPGEQPQGGENSEAPEKPDGDDAKADGDAKGSKDADSEKQTMPAQTSHQIQMKQQKILNQRMTHPQITQTKAKRQMVTVMVRSSGRRSTIYVRSDRRRTGNHSYRQHSDYRSSPWAADRSTWWRSAGEPDGDIHDAAPDSGIRIAETGRG
ncbi:MAG: hypothetical protein ACLUGJ_16195 [Blautia wexlerae]